MLKRFWIRFHRFDRPTPLNLGCGVTAETRDEAIELVRERVFRNNQNFEIKEIIDDIDIRTLDPGHVLPNMEVPTSKGIWYPKGYK